MLISDSNLPSLRAEVFFWSSCWLWRTRAWPLFFDSCCISCMRMAWCANYSLAKITIFRVVSSKLLQDRNDFELSTLPALVPVLSTASGETLLLLVKRAELIVNKVKALGCLYILSYQPYKLLVSPFDVYNTKTHGYLYILAISAI